MIALYIILGIIIGALWGYVRKLDVIITEIYNVLDNIPTTIVLVLLTYIMRPSITTLIFAMCMTGWLGMARFVRNQIIIIRDREYNLASRCLGTPTSRIISKNLYNKRNTPLIKSYRQTTCVKKYLISKFT